MQVERAQHQMGRGAPGPGMVPEPADQAVEGRHVLAPHPDDGVTISGDPPGIDHLRPTCQVGLQAGRV
ncbi:MAG TPA: hypothetical protein VGP16_35320, partial [Asanoa sp.]|nr:hypothetical protein [Asanoa sp.]